MNRTRQFWRRLLLAGMAAAVCLTATGLPAQNRGKGARRPRDVSLIRKQHADRQAKFALALKELARTCADKGLADAAEYIRVLAEPVGAVDMRLTPLPRQVELPLRNDLSADERYWRAQLRSQQKDYARDLYALSRQALNAGHVNYAFDLIREVALHDSDNANARKILGFVRSGDEWVSAFAASMARQKKVWNDQYGWIPRDHVERYDRGERMYKGRWISAAKEAEIRHDFVNAWEIRTEHYLVRTNHSLERGVELATKLEDLHSLFFQLMAGFFNSAEQVQQLFAGNSARAAMIARPNVINYYRTRDEYLAAVRKETNQQVEITRGIYFPRNGIAFFFYDPDNDDDSTLYHEATHQLLSGSRPQTGEIGIKSNFWVIEGIACYMETFHRGQDGFSVGNPAHERIQAARHHFLVDRYYVPLRDFARMGMAAFQTAQEIRSNYSQGAALTHFFMHYDDGRYREALIEHLSQVYSPIKSVCENPESLDDLTGVAAEELDRQYADYIRNLAPPSVQEVPLPADQTAP